MLDKIKLALAAAMVVAGVWAFYHFGDIAPVLRVLMVLAGLLAAAGVASLSEPGRQLFAFGQEAWAEAAKVSWPTRKETLQTTLVVFGFVVIMAVFLFAVDSSLAWLIKLITGRSEG
jgi:preprotein translocase subunit SecE